MALFYAPFIPGLQNFIAEIIKERLDDVIIHKLLDGAVLFETKTNYDKLNFFCFNNIFAVISIMEHTEKHNALEKHIRAFLDGSGGASVKEAEDANQIIANNSKSFNTFRIVISDENKPASIDEKLRVEAEKAICRLSSLKVNRALPDAEFWFLFRREDGLKMQNFSVFMKRLTVRSSWEKTLHKGELPPPLSWILCRLANLVHSDTVLDPFCGYGSIPDAALKHFHIKNFIACDNDREAASYCAARFKKKEGFVLHKGDFSELPFIIKEKKVDVIITDPPWGHYKEINDSDFYKKMFELFCGLLKEGGRAVVLCANDDLFLRAVPVCFELQSSIPILLSGRKAVIFVFRRK
ncbi:MAG: methyltransferase domain-containing protein [Treponema sp.]|nr:methyltransferase domain-containing protein [Treponema sp.]